VRYEFEITYDDFEAAQKLSARHPRNWIVLVKEPWDAIIVMSAIGMFILMDGGNQRLAGLFPLSIAAWHWYNGVFSVRREWKRQYAAKSPDGHAVVFEPTDEAFCIAYKCWSNSIPWVNLKKWRESKTHLIVCQPDATMHIIPKRIFAGNLELEMLREKLTHAVGKSV
jgi:hypothetical protein